MRITHKNLKQGEIKVVIENLDDIWYLSQVIDAGDRISGKTFRKIKVTEEADPTKKSVFLAIEVEQIEYSTTTSQLRVSGKVTDGPEDVPRGSYHTFALEPGVTVTITKDEWHQYQLARMTEAAESKPTQILITVFDREDAIFALVTRQGHKILGKIKGDVAKKAIEQKVKGGFYEEIIAKLEDYDKRQDLNQIILASPAFWKDELDKVLTQKELRKKVIFATCSGVSENAIHEVLKRDETKKALQQTRVSHELRKVEALLEEIATQGKAAYGLNEAEQAANAGAIETLLVTDGLIRKARQEDTFEKLNAVMKTAEQTRADIIIVGSDNDAGKKLDGLGGIGALLRYNLEFS